MNAPTILIERVANGWIVRPFQPGDNWCCPEKQQTWVYSTVEELIRDIPKLISPDEKVP